VSLDRLYISILSESHHSDPSFALSNLLILVNLKTYRIPTEWIEMKSFQPIAGLEFEIKFQQNRPPLTLFIRIKNHPPYTDAHPERE